MDRCGLDHRAAWRDKPVETLGLWQCGEWPALRLSGCDGNEGAQVAFEQGDIDTRREGTQACVVQLDTRR